MFKQVYLFDGTPYLAYLNDEGEYVYPNDEYTDVPPPEGIYQPFYYDGNEWIGTSKEDWERNQSKPPIEPKVLEMLVSQLQLQMMIGNKKTKELEDKLKITEKTLAETVMKVTELENEYGGNA
ncbi:hypothetical protein CD117_04010 [Mammaliicoccus sciuri]|uniref:Uncharacterized protein n=1 Tax=Mammaliicoccus sciuri TaxID=1296 RepID=A0AAJ4VIE7_MAMSC|nr:MULTISPECIES: hypothetical protein [Mammaliicoccus]MCJ0913287.1 hypothetical protein [Mammaliicoccus sciuri]RTX73759.1 hypothetical protein CD117_04010 [Mammaliicoccus sciuri]